MHVPLEIARALESLGLLAVIAVWSAGIAKGGKRPSILYAILALLTFAISQYWCWTGMSGIAKSDTVFYVIGYIAYIIASLAFLSGTCIVTTHCLEYKGDKLCIDKDNKFLAFANKYGVLHLEDGRSICAVSWVVALILLVTPIIMTAVSMLATVASLVCCLTTGQSMPKFFMAIIKFRQWPEAEMQYTERYHLPKGPLVYVGIAFVVYLVIDLIVEAFRNFSSVLHGLLIAGLVIGLFAITWCILIAISRLAIGRVETIKDKDSNIKNSLCLYYDVSSALEPIVILGVLWQAFRHKHCPKIEYCSFTDGGCGEKE